MPEKTNSINCMFFGNVVTQNRKNFHNIIIYSSFPYFTSLFFISPRTPCAVGTDPKWFENLNLGNPVSPMQLHKNQRTQARNQLGIPGGAKSFLRGAQIFLTLPNSFKLCPTHFPGGPRHPWLWAWMYLEAKAFFQDPSRVSTKNVRNNGSLQKHIFPSSTIKISKFSSNQLNGLRLHLFAMIRTCTYLYSGN